MFSKEFLLRTLELASWKCHNSNNKNVLNNVKRIINRITFEHEKINLPAFHSAAVIVFNLTSAKQHAYLDSSHAGSIIEDAIRTFISQAILFFTNNPPVLFKIDLLGNTPLYTCITHKNETLTNSIFKILSNEQLIFLISSRHGKNLRFITPIEQIIESKWNFFIKHLNIHFSDNDFSNLMEKLNTPDFFPQETRLLKEPILTVAVKNLKGVSTPDYIKFVAKMIEHSNLCTPFIIDSIITTRTEHKGNILHYAVRHPKLSPIANLLLDKLKLPSTILSPLFFAKDSDGRTPLQVAVIGKSFDIAFNILSRADNKILFLKDNFNRSTYDYLIDYSDITPVNEHSSNDEHSLVLILNLLDNLQYKKNTIKPKITHHIAQYFNIKEKFRSFNFQPLQNSFTCI